LRHTPQRLATATQLTFQKRGAVQGDSKPPGRAPIPTRITDNSGLNLWRWRPPAQAGSQIETVPKLNY